MTAPSRSVGPRSCLRPLPPGHGWPPTRRPRVSRPSNRRGPPGPSILPASDRRGDVANLAIEYSTSLVRATTCPVSTATSFPGSTDSPRHVGRHLIGGCAEYAAGWRCGLLVQARAAPAGRSAAAVVHERKFRYGRIGFREVERRDRGVPTVSQVHPPLGGGGRASHVRACSSQTRPSPRSGRAAS